MTDSVSVNALSVEDRKYLKKVILELNDSLTRADAERELQREAIKEAHDKIGVDKKIIRRMAKTYFKANFGVACEEHREFEQFYDTVIKNTVP